MSSDCPACDNQGITTLVPADDYRYVCCSACRSLYLDPMPDPQPREGDEHPPTISDAVQRQVAHLLRRASADPEARVGTNSTCGHAATEAGLNWVPFGPKPPDGSDAQFDAVVLSNFIERQASPAAAVASVRRGLRPGGAIVLITPNANFARIVLALTRRSSRPGTPSPRAILDAPRRTVIFSPHGLRALVESQGFGVVHLGARARGGAGHGADRLEMGIHALSQAVQLLLRRVILNPSMVCLARRED